MTNDKEQRRVVLIIDDQPQNLQLAASVLNPLYRLILADSGEKALALTSKKQPDIILLDMMMPGMSGIEVCERLKSNPNTRDIPVIFVTAKTDERDILRAYEVGGIDYIQKPFRTNELLARVAAHVTLKAQHENIIHLNQELSALNKQKSQLLSIIAHDMRGAMSFIDNMLDLLISDIEKTPIHELQEYMNLVKETSEKTYTMFDELLVWAKNQSEHIELVQTRVNVAEAIQKVVDQIQLQIAAKGLQITIANSDTYIYADANMFGTIIRNLLSNAIKFSDSNQEIAIHISSNDTMANISISDQGVGIKSEDISKVLDPIQNFTTRGTKGEKGTGLGFDLCRNFIERHGGMVQVQSEYGQGTTITFTMPLSPTQTQTNNSAPVAMV